MFLRGFLAPKKSRSEFCWGSSKRGRKELVSTFSIAKMAVSGPRDQDKLDGASNFVIWKARILAVLDEHQIKDHALNMIFVLVDADPVTKYEEAQAKAKHMIMDRLKIM